MIGNIIDGTITNSYASGDVISNSESGDKTSSNVGGLIGGLVGFNGNCTITNSYATGKVISKTNSNYSMNDVGGLIGGNITGTIINCYAVGDISVISKDKDPVWGSDNAVGGLIGFKIDSTIKNSYRYGEQQFTIQSNTQIKTDNIAKTMEELKSYAFHTDTLGWSSDDWVFVEGEYPRLKNVGAVIN